MSHAIFDAHLIRRYDINGPRYTSYPTADRFRDGDWTQEYATALAAADGRALSLYLHVPFCATICFYCACNKINTANSRRADAYVQRLIHEMELQSKMIEGTQTVEQLHFGGGTPTFLSDDQFSRIFDALDTHFLLGSGNARDFSVEIDPRNVAAERIEHLTGLGINRLSIGVQDFDPDVQKAVNRVQSIEETSYVIDAARSNGVRSVNIDLINGLPRQTPGRFERTLERVLELQPDRLSLYSYAHLPQRFKTQRQINAAELPTAETKLALLELAVEMLADADYVYVGMDHFAKQSDSLITARNDGTLHRNFQGYTTHGHCNLLGLGVSSIGKVGRVYVQNAKSLADYYEAIDSKRLACSRGIVASTEDLVVGEVIQDLMCCDAVDFASFRERAGCDFQNYFAYAWPKVLDLQQHGLIQLDEDALRVTGRGRFLLRNICMAFDPWLRAAGERFSRAI
ncbi:MAG: oxygen-independent coproporphyrinogen III oxidase [Gammaproteobacteria bacterium]|nr:oxygen-independent coproporphyrinogen III oxidase [Gammaproteobacteria bacterium]